MLDEVRRYIRRERMLARDQAVHVAVSGGVDSMVLLHVLRRLGHPCSVAHVDHGLRGAESEADALFVQEYCRAARIPCQVRRVDVDQHMQQHGGSVQMAAREMRRAWFAELYQEKPMPIALAHHADDAVETLFLHLLRGTGAQGWASIAPVSGIFVRPLLGLHRDTILGYAQEHDIPFREDTSNKDPKYLRNRVRHEVLSLLEDLRPGSRRTIARSIDLLRELEEAGQQISTAQLAGIRPGPDGTSVVSFATIESSATPRLLLHRMLRHLGFHPDLIVRIHDAIIDRATGALFTAGAWQVSVDRQALVISSLKLDRPVYYIDPTRSGTAGPFAWSMEEGGSAAPVHDRNEVLLDADRLSFPVELRPWRDGDRMRPLGLGGSKLISDILTDARVGVHDRRDHYVLESAGEIAWLASHRIGEGFQATAATRSVLRIVKGRP